MTDLQADPMTRETLNSGAAPCGHYRAFTMLQIHEDGSESPYCMQCHRDELQKELADLRLRAQRIEALEAENERLRDTVASFAECASIFCPYEKRMRAAEDQLQAHQDRVQAALVAARDALVAFGNQAGLVPGQNGYSTTMTDAEMKVAQAVQDLDTLIDKLTAADAGDTHGKA